MLWKGTARLSTAHGVPPFVFAAVPSRSNVPMDSGATGLTAISRLLVNRRISGSYMVARGALHSLAKQVFSIKLPA